MNSIVFELKQKKNLFLKTCHLVNALEKYSRESTLENESNLNIIAYNTDGLMLPNGRYGNPIALALGINDYISALYLIKNADGLNIDNEYISRTYSGKKQFALKDEYILSLATFKGLKDPYLEYVHENKGLNEFTDELEYVFKQISACEEIESRLDIKEADKKLIKELK